MFINNDIVPPLHELLQLKNGNVYAKYKESMLFYYSFFYEIINEYAYRLKLFEEKVL